MAETPENRIKRLRMRSWRRGTKEMDLVLGPYADTQIAALDAVELARYEALLGENDQDLYAWFTGLLPEPQEHAACFARIRAFHDNRLAAQGD